MSYARASIFQFKQGTTNEGLRRAQQGLLPLLQKELGFVSFRVVTGENDRGISIAEYEEKNQAESALRKAQKWVQDNLRDLIASTDAFVGEVSLEAEGTQPVSGTFGAGKGSQQPGAQH